jgi:tRNA A22 N-methylase
MPDVILISEKTMKSLRYSVKVNEIHISEENTKVEGLKIFELISQTRTDHDHSP